MRSGNKYRRLYSGGLAWTQQFRALDGSVPAVIIWPERGLYALPMGLTSTSAGSASVSQLTSLRPATFAECFAFATANTTERSFVGADGLIKTDPGANTPRIDYSSGAAALRLENAATNYSTNSNCRTRTSTTSGETFNIEGCYGLLGVLFAEWNGTSSHGFQPTGSRTVAIGEVYTWSMYVKPRETNFVQLTMLGAGFGTGQYCNFELTGAGTLAATGCTGTIAALPAPWTGWYRISMTATATANTALAAPGQISAGLSIADGRLPLYTGVNLKLMFEAAGSQWELSAFPSSLIQTNGSSVSRLIETARFSPLVEAILQRAAGSIDVRVRLSNTSTAARALIGNDGTGTLLYATDGAQNTVTNANGVGPLTATLGSGAFNTSSVAAALSFDSGGRSAVANNGTVSTSASPVASKTVTYLGRSPSSSTYGDGLYTSVVIYPNRLSDSALRARTA
jgi:hypothetical protein